MNFKHILCIAFIGLSTVASAQKYKSISNNTITKDWQDIAFMTSILEDEFLSSQLSSQEMITVFVANDTSFMALKEDTRKALMADDQKITQLVKFHTIPGRVDKNAIEKAISTSGGRAYFITLEGEKLGVTKKAGVLTISDSKGNTAVIQETDFYHKNGFFHMVEGFAFDTKASQ